jgi:hypothetical protein
MHEPRNDDCSNIRGRFGDRFRTVALVLFQGGTLMATFIMVTAVILTGPCVLLWGLVLALVAANVVVALCHLAAK